MLLTLIWSQAFGLNTETTWPISTASAPWKGRAEDQNGPFSLHAVVEAYIVGCFSFKLCNVFGIADIKSHSFSPSYLKGRHR